MLVGDKWHDKWHDYALMTNTMEKTYVGAWQIVRYTWLLRKCYN